MAATDLHKAHFEDFRRYYSGEMSHHEQFYLEKRMLEDPFLADAYEGFVATMQDKVDADKALEDLSEALERRVQAKKSRVVPLWVYATAASVVLSLSWLFYTNNVEDKLMNSSSDLATAPIFKNDSSASSQSAALPLSNHDSATNVVIDRPDFTQRAISSKIEGTSDRLAFNEKLSPVEGEKDREENTVVSPDAAPEIVVKESSTDAAQEAQKKEPAKPAPVLSAPSFLSRAKSVATARKSVNNYFVVQGRVVDANGTGLPGVTVLKSFSQGTLTDSIGRFNITVPQSDSLKLIGLGYQPKSVAVTKADLGVIVMDENLQALNEVVVAGYSKVKKKSQDSRGKVRAAPVGGWEQYNIYLSRAAKKALQNGDVKATFRVNSDGTLSDFETKGSSVLADLAIKILRDGPAWEPARKGELKIAEMVTIKVSFD